MKTIFWGLLITWLHFNLNIGAMQIELLPSAVGWYFVLQGIRELPPCSARDNAEGPVRVMIGLSAVVWCMQLVGGLGILGSAVSLMETCVHAYVLYLLIELIAAVERMVSHRMPIEQLRLGWKIWTVCVVFGALLGFSLFLITLAAALAVSCALAAFVASIYLLVQFWNAAKAYEEAMAHPIEILSTEEGKDHSEE